MARFNKATVANIVTQLEGMLEGSQSALENAESADYPNDERIDSLNSRCDALQSAIDALGEIEE